jgi:plasmid stabilization system protein ParE
LKRCVISLKASRDLNEISDYFVARNIEAGERLLRSFVVGVRSVVVDRFSDERTIPVPGGSANAFETVKPNVFTLELLLDGDVVAEFAIVYFLYNVDVAHCENAWP